MNESKYRSNIYTCLLRYIKFLASDTGFIGDRELAKFINEAMDSCHHLPLMKLNRWLGYIQGVLIERGYTTVEEERDFTRPLFRPFDYAE